MQLIAEDLLVLQAKMYLNLLQFSSVMGEDSAGVSETHYSTNVVDSSGNAALYWAVCCRYCCYITMLAVSV